MVYLTIVLLNFADLVLTHIGVNVMGFYEVNPFMRPLVSSWAIIPVKLIPPLVMTYVLCRIARNHPDVKAIKLVAWGVATIYFLVVVSNTVNIIM